MVTPTPQEAFNIQAQALGSADGDGSITTTRALEGVGAAFEALAAIRAGQSRAATLQVKSAFERFNAEQEFVAARGAANEIARIREETVGSINAAFAANGVDLSSDTAIIAGERARAQAGLARKTVLTAGEIRRETRRINAQNLLIQAENEIAASGLEAFGIFIRAAGSIAKAG